MQAALRTTNPLPYHPVSQLAKTHLPTLKPNASNDLDVSKPKQKASHTPTHGIAVDLKKVGEFVRLVKSIHSVFVVAFSSNHYLTNQFSNCSKEALELFLSLTQTFTLLNHYQRKTDVENVLQTTDADYEQAYQLWLQCQPKKTNHVYLPTLQRVKEFVQFKFKANQSFTALSVALQLNLSDIYVSNIMNQMVQQNQLVLLSTTAANGRRLLSLHKN